MRTIGERHKLAPAFYHPTVPKKNLGGSFGPKKTFSSENRRGEVA